jgi:hypothetical protein
MFMDQQSDKQLTFPSTSHSIARIDAFFDLAVHFVKRLKLLLREAESLFLELAIVILAVLKLLDMILK